MTFPSEAVTSENYWRIISRVTKTSSFLQSAIANTQRNRRKTPLVDGRANVANVVYNGPQSIVLLRRHANTHCDVILTDCPQNVSILVTCVFPPLSNYRSLIIKSYLWLIHGLSCRKRSNKSRESIKESWSNPLKQMWTKAGTHCTVQAAFAYRWWWSHSPMFFFHYCAWEGRPYYNSALWLHGWYGYRYCDF